MYAYTFSFLIPDTNSTRVITTFGNNVNEGRKELRAILDREDILWLLEPIELIEPTIRESVSTNK
jgi:hypothetical protein